VSAAFDPVRFWARVAPERLAIRSGKQAWSYAQLDEAVDESAESLFAQGLDAGQHVAVEFEPAHGFQFAIALHALHRIGLLPVPIGAALTPAERKGLRDRSLAELTLASADLDPGDVAPRAGLERPAEPARSAPATERPPLARRLETPASLCFTSGTAGEPQAAILTHGNFLWSALASARNLGVHADDLWLCAVPLHHVAGLSILTRSAHYGTGVLLQSRFDPDEVNEAIDREGVTLLSLVPPMLERLLRARGGRLFPTRLRAALVGGGPIPTPLLEEAAELRLRALPTYGMTETASQAATLSPREWPEGLGSAGRPLPFVRMEIRDAKGRALPRGEEGEIFVRGPMVAAGYFNAPDSSAAAFEGRWFRTGDIGAWDAAGRLLVLDRRSDRIVVGGENVSPAEVERALRGHPAVADACVVGVSADAWGQEVAAAIQLRPGEVATPEEILRYAAATLSAFKLPRRIAVVPALPRSASGKLLRRVIRDRFLDRVPVEEGA